MSLRDVNCRPAFESDDSTRPVAARARARWSLESEFASSRNGSVGPPLAALRRRARTGSRRACATTLSQEKSRVVSVGSRRPSSELRTPVSPTVRTTLARLSGGSAGPGYSALVRRWLQSPKFTPRKSCRRRSRGPQFTARAPPGPPPKPESISLASVRSRPPPFEGVCTPLQLVSRRFDSTRLDAPCTRVPRGPHASEIASSKNGSLRLASGLLRFGVAAPLDLVRAQEKTGYVFGPEQGSLKRFQIENSWPRHTWSGPE